MNISSVENGGNNSAEKCGSGIIGVSLYLSGEIDKVIKSERLSHKVICTNKTCDNAGGRASETSCHRDIVHLFDRKSMERVSAYFKKGFCGMVNEI